MILRRLGNKSKIAKEIQKYFPKHKIYIEPFFGAGGMFFNKPKANHNFLNDLDSDVFNLFQVISTNKDEFIDLFIKMPIHQELFDYWMHNLETEPLKKALRFLFLSNFSLYSKMDTLRLGCVKPKEQVFKFIDETFEFIKNVQFTNCDFRTMFQSISLCSDEISETLIYADPPYLKTTNNYSNNFNENDCIELLDYLQNTKAMFAYSEFNNDFILNEAKKRNLNIVYIKERQTLKNRNIEILITNYQVAKSLFDDCN